MKLNRLLVLCAAAFVAAASPALAAQTDAPTAAPAQDEEQIPPASYIIANTQTISPLNLVYAINEYWMAGDRLQAAFWFYIWQIRTAPWAELDPELAPIRATLNEQLGGAINGWLAADPALMRQVAERALSYEATLPLWTQRPEGISEQFWLSQVQADRVGYATELNEALTPQSYAQIITARQERGMPVGLPADLGAPLPDNWR